MVIMTPQPFLRRFFSGARIATALLAAPAFTFPASAQTAPPKPQPSGIVRLFAINFSRPENLGAWYNPSIAGMRLRPQWAAIQPQPSTYNWSGIDEVLSLGTQHGKFVGLSVSAGVYTPQWVYAAGAAKYAIQDGSRLSMSLPWDATFQSKWLPFVRTLGARYDGNPALGYVVMSGFGQIVESYMAQTAQDTTRLTGLGGAAAWTAAAKTIISTYAQAFPTTPFVMTAAKPFPTADGVTALQQVIDWGVATYPGRFGIMNCSLNAVSDTGYYPHLAVYTYHNTQPVGFQTVCSYAKDPARMQGTLAQTLNAGTQLGAKYIELYQADADAPANQQLLANQAAILTTPH